MIVMITWDYNMSNRKQQITKAGIARISGLDVFSSIINYTGEYLNFGNAFPYQTQLGSDTDHATTSTTPIPDALVNNPPSVLNRWYRFHSSGSPYVAVNAPASASGFFIYYGQKTGSAISYSGMYQRLSGLIKNNKYQISVQSAISTGTGTLYIETWIYYVDGYVRNSQMSVSFPVSNNSVGITTSEFTAAGSNDIIVIYFTTTSASSTNVAITDISIKEKQEYLVPIAANDVWGNNHKVLRSSVQPEPYEEEE